MSVIETPLVLDVNKRTFLLVLQACLLTACNVPVGGSAAPTASPGVFIPTANVRLEPATSLDKSAAAEDPSEAIAAHLYRIGPGPATRLRRPTGNNGLFLAVGTPELDTPGTDIDLALDQAAANKATAEDAPELPTGPGCALPAIGLAGDIGSFRVNEVSPTPPSTAPGPARAVDQFTVIRAGLPPPLGQAFDEVEINARRVVDGTHCQVYLDGSVTDAVGVAAGQAIAAAFDDHIYPNDVRVFGAPPEPGIDGESKIYIVISPEVSGRGRSSALAYFARRDLFRREPSPPSHARSNQKEVLFIDALVLAPERRQDLLSAVAHEFQHLIHYHQKAQVRAVAGGESLWLDESLAMYASQVCGYGVDTSQVMYQHVAGYLSRAYKYSLTDWQGNPGEQGYGMGFLFVTYLADRFGQDLITSLVKSDRRGKSNLDEKLRARGSSYREAFEDWSVALANDGLFNDQTGRYGFKSLHVRGPNPFGALHGPSAIRIGPSGAHLPRRADVAFLFHWKPDTDTAPLILRSRGGPFGAVALIP